MAKGENLHSPKKKRSRFTVFWSSKGEIVPGMTMKMMMMKTLRVVFVRRWPTLSYEDRAGTQSGCLLLLSF